MVKGLGQLELSKKLVTIKQNVHLDVSIDNLKVGTPNEKLLEEIYKELEFKAWLEEKNTLPNNDHKKRKTDYRLISTSDELDRWISKIKKSNSPHSTLSKN